MDVMLAQCSFLRMWSRCRWIWGVCCGAACDRQQGLLSGQIDALLLIAHVHIQRKDARVSSNFPAVAS
eukprot:285487-Amphidinium_carterae.1